MSHPPNAKFLGFLDKDASDEEIAEFIQRAIATGKKAQGEAEGLEGVPLGETDEAEQRFVREAPDTRATK